MADELWTYHSLLGGMERTSALTLIFEVNGTPMSDDYTPEEINAAELFRRWAAKYVDGDGWVSVAWFVEGGGTFEAAPFQRDFESDFLTHYSWPARGAERLNWNRAPIADGQWGSASATKGGFFQEHTGFKPAPFTPRLHVPTILRQAGW